jgi:hypothetical protein
MMRYMKCDSSGSDRGETFYLLSGLFYSSVSSKPIRSLPVISESLEIISLLLK